jgi:hypothetical protein
MVRQTRTPDVKSIQLNFSFSDIKSLKQSLITVKQEEIENLGSTVFMKSRNLAPSKNLNGNSSTMIILEIAALIFEALNLAITRLPLDPSPTAACPSLLD